MVDVLANPAVALYVAAGVALVVMLGFFIYLWSLDRRVRELQQVIDGEAPARAPATARLHGIEEPAAVPGRSEPLRPQPIEKGAK